MPFETRYFAHVFEEYAFFYACKKKAPHCRHRNIDIDLAELFGNYSVHIFGPLFFYFVNVK